MFTYAQLLYVAKKANKLGGRGCKLVQVIPPTLATQSDEDFVFVSDPAPCTSATQVPWYEE